MRIAVFSAKNYERVLLDEINASHWTRPRLFRHAPRARYSITRSRISEPSVSLLTISSTALC